MIVYHIDRSGSLREGMTFALLPSGLSRHGERYWGAIPIDRTDLISDFFIEHIFEEVRLAHYPDKPSRFTSAFACLTPAEAEFWKDMYPEFRGHPVWKIQAPSSFVGDASLLRCLLNKPEGKVFDLEFAYSCAHEYWLGASVQCPTAGFPYKDLFRTCTPQWEVLLPPEAKVIGRHQ